MADGSEKSNKVANSLVAMSSAAVLAVYAAGYSRTRSAAEALETRAAQDWRSCSMRSIFRPLTLIPRSIAMYAGTIGDHLTNGAFRTAGLAELRW